MKPAEEIEAAFCNSLVHDAEAGAYSLAAEPVHIRLQGDLNETTIAAAQIGQLSFTIPVEGSAISVRLPQDDGSIQDIGVLPDAADIRVIHDRGVIEIFVDGGAVCGTRRSYLNTVPHSISIKSKSSSLIHGFGSRSDCR
ncbi:GH32 C-terminal domain-containing protein [Rhizobium mongolense]|uniref:Sucrose-6-phosphate hydrolase SacC (GH32 family) n=1 Tax=Rhizobium mongolense TaxID=57676 RepID=A0A7W6RUT8_9HYPH|nr:GH32 C-terminal domain-containing protein [Rhizobium mongolense]MBB4279024.1 sucrose-6-phosphate hydrolase SacC (GH32 family) [Rhizobium mongolense]